ncbi:MAG TPA: alkaline phosphatase family protein [Polyangiaceae bacterium]|jgi:hypothetical protein
MRWDPALGVGLLAASSLASVASCGVGSGYSVWWEQDKGATAPPPGHEATEGGAKVEAGADARPVEGGHPESGPAPVPIHTVFFVLMSKKPWSAIEGSTSAPYINGKLLPAGAHCTNYFAAPVMIEQSEPNELWLEAGQDFGFTVNQTPTQGSTASTAHLVDELEAASIPWKAYVDGITAGTCPIANAYPYETYHVPFLYFDDVSGKPPSPLAKRCIQHVVPMTELAKDLAADTVPRYAFVVPDLCNDMHDDCNTGDPVNQGDTWLASTVPGILSSKTYAAGGALFVAWDFDPAGYNPVGLIVLGANAKPGFAGGAKATHSATLRTLQEIFDVTPLLGDAANATDMAGMFTSFP